MNIPRCRPLWQGQSRQLQETINAELGAALSRNQKNGGHKDPSPATGESKSRSADDRFNKRIETQRPRRTQRRT